MARTDFRTVLTRSAMAAAAAAFAAVASAPDAGAATYVWNNTGPTWESGTDWTPAGPPTAADVASFDPTVANAGVTVVNPTVNAADAAGTLFLADNYLGGAYSFTGSGSLTLGNAFNASNGSGGAANAAFNLPGGVVVRGFGTTTVNVGGGTATSLTATNGSVFNVGSGAALTLGGNTIAALGTVPITLLGGTLTIDNSGGTPAGGPTVTSTGTVTLNGGGSTLAFVGPAAGTTFTGLVGAALSSGAGTDTVSVSQPAAATAATVVQFKSLARGNTSAAFIFNAVGGGTLGGGGANPSITFATAPTTAGGIISSSATSILPYAIVTRPAATGGAVVGDWATYNTTTGIQAAASTPTTGDFSTATTATAAAGDNINFTPSANVTLGGTPNALSSVVINPQAAGLTLDLATNGSMLNTAGVMLSGGTDFTVSGGQLVAGGTNTGTKTVFVSNPTTALTTSAALAGTNTGPVSFGGPGFLVLNGAADQFASSTATAYTANVNLLGGTLRGSPTSLGYAADPYTLRFRGGVLEVDGTGVVGGSTFARTIGQGQNQVNWASNGPPNATSNSGGGGFSAFGGPLTVGLAANNASGVTVQNAPLVWNGTAGFVPDGYAFIFGSTRSNAVTTLTNALGLDAGATGAYAAREVRVVGGTGGDATVFSGVVTGSATTDLLKTGTGKLVLTGANTYAGRTFVEGGTLVNNSSTGTGTVTVNATGTLAGTGTSVAVNLPAGGTLSTGSGGTAADTIGKFTVGSLNASGGTYTVKLDGSQSTPAAANSGGSATAGVGNGELVLSGLTVAGTTALTVNPVAVTAGASSFAGGKAYSYVIADANTPAAAASLVAAFGAGQIALGRPAFAASDTLGVQTDGSGGEDLLLNITAAPEPTSLLLAGLAAAPLMLGRRRRVHADARGRASAL